MNMRASARFFYLLATVITNCPVAADQSPAPDQTTDSRHSAGCSVSRKGSGQFITQELNILNRQRVYHLRIPSTYSAAHAYPLIFRWHGSGGNGLSGGMEIENFAQEDAIIVSADGLDKNWDASADSESLLMDERYEYLRFNTDPADLLFFDQMLENTQNQYCIDSHRIFSYGFSAGGGFSNLLACERGEVLRANAAIASWPRGSNCKGQVATWLLHDRNDQAVPYTKGVSVRESMIKRNGCSADANHEDANCVIYQGCGSNPVVWCETAGIGHNIQSAFAPSRVWKFFSSLQ